MARQKVTRKSRDMVHASGSRSSKVSSTSTPSRVDGPLPAENDVIDLTGLLSSDSDDSESDDGKARVKDKGKIKANEKARVKEEKDGNSVSSKVKLEPSGKREPFQFVNLKFIFFSHSGLHRTRSSHYNRPDQTQVEREKVENGEREADYLVFRL